MHIYFKAEKNEICENEVQVCYALSVWNVHDKEYKKKLLQI